MRQFTKNVCPENDFSRSIDKQGRIKSEGSYRPLRSGSALRKQKSEIRELAQEEAV